MTSHKKIHRSVSSMWALFALIGLVCCASSSMAAEPRPAPSPSPVASPAASPLATLEQSVSELTAQRAATERSKIYQAGATYSRWLDGIAKDSGYALLQRQVADRVTWMGLL